MNRYRWPVEYLRSTDVIVFSLDEGVPLTATVRASEGPRQTDSTSTTASRSEFDVEITVPTNATGASARAFASGGANTQDAEAGLAEITTLARHTAQNATAANPTLAR